MTPRPRRTLRREPRQPRSIEMVERIVKAGETVLLQRGYDATTTNHIAAAAEISPGSLYQYFPDKQAILAEVTDRYSTELIARMSRAFLEALRAPTDDAVRLCVTALLDAFAEQPDLLRVVVEQVPRSADSDRATFARRMDDMLTTAILSDAGHNPTRPAETVAWILVRTVEHVTISYTLERPAFDRSTVVDELTGLITRYLDLSRAP